MKIHYSQRPVIIALYLQGKTLAQLAQRYHVCISTIHKIVTGVTNGKERQLKKASVYQRRWRRKKRIYAASSSTTK